MSEDSSGVGIGPEGLLSLEGRLLLFLYRKGTYRGSKADFADLVGSSPSRVHQELEKLEQDGLILTPPKARGYELTRKGRLRIRQFVVPRGLILVSVVLSAFVLAEGIFTAFFGPVPTIGFLPVGVIFFAYSLILVRYYFSTESRILKGKSRPK